MRIQKLDDQEQQHIKSCYVLLQIQRYFESLELVFCYQNCSDPLWEKNCSSDWEKLLKLETEGR